ncbi:unnamed protein product [Aureobasidium mustum]|uniref:Uncharacterized protein n=1 Tax=Aureobasidium mustum TaxID=2773714 RepID=A0A9N8JYM1_9PEZI|nr:unnamed protein product [Aureobasidium mustum]
MSRRTMTSSAVFIRDGKEYLEIDNVSDQELKKVGVYLSMILGESGNLVGLYVGSRTGHQGVYQRTEGYNRVKKGGKVWKTDAYSAHIQMALKPGYTWHIRPLFLADKAGIPPARVFALKGIFTDLLNTISYGAVKETLSFWCAEDEPLYPRCEIVAGEENISSCKKCHYNWDHFKKKYLLDKSPEVKRKHWTRFVKHQKSGLTSEVGNFKWTEHDCEIYGAEANRTPPPGYPNRNNVKFCLKCYNAAKATKKNLA